MSRKGLLLACSLLLVAAQSNLLGLQPAFAKGTGAAFSWPTDKEQSNDSSSSKSTSKDNADNSATADSTDKDKAASPSAADDKAKAEEEAKKPYAPEAVKHYNKGVELHQSGFLNQAIDEYKAAIDADPRMEEAYSNLGLIYTAQRNYAKAIDALTKAIELKPGRTYTLNGLATVLYARGRLKEALDKWQDAIKIDPNFASAYYNIGRALENEKEYSQAMDYYVKAMKINPKMADPYYQLGGILNHDKHYAQANYLLTKSIELAPDAEFAHDAKRQLASIDAQFDKEEDAPELKMQVMPPPDSQSAKDNVSQATEKSEDKKR